MRRTRFGRAIVCACLLFLILAPGSLAATASEPLAIGGDIRFHARSVAFRHGASEARAEFSIRVPYREIKFVPKADSLFEGKLRVTVEMWNTAGKRAAYRQQEAQVQITDLAAGMDSLLGEVYALGLTARMGKYRYRVLVEDMNVARMGLIYKMKSQKRQGKIEGEVDLGPWLFRGPALSGIETAWDISTAPEAAAFRKGPYDVYPHPSGYYGLYRDVVSGYYEIYDSDVPPGGRSYRVHSYILGADGDTISTGTDSLRVTEGSAWPHVIRIDVSAFAAGHYRLILKLERTGEGISALSTADFDVLWAEDSWLAEAADFYDVGAGVLLSSSEAPDFRALPMGAKEVRIEKAWRDVDPSPETAENEARQEFRRRVAYANSHYTIYTRGMFTDRGRVYIRFGDPDDIQIERLPVAGKTLDNAIGNTIPQQSKEALTKSRGGGDFRPYEIWTYNGRGNEAAHRFGLNELTSGLKFVFVDEQGYGEYTLRYSSSSGIH